MPSRCLLGATRACRSLTFSSWAPALPERLTPPVLRDAIARALTSKVKAYDIVEECDRLGLAPSSGEPPLMRHA